MKTNSLPTVSQRLAARVPATGSPVMYQRWRNLLFLHWEYSAELLQETLPDGLFVDTFGGKAYLGIVPFFMQNIRPRFLPAVPGISNFMELNLRTYVYDREGVPGVWFYSLDANQSLAVAIARRFFHLPYHRARMNSSITNSGAIRYESERAKKSEHQAKSIFEYKQGIKLPEPEPDSLEFFLVERYRLFSAFGAKLWRGEVFHPPYPLFRSEPAAWNEALLKLNDFEPTGRPPDHVVMSTGVDVNILPLKRIK